MSTMSVSSRRARRDAQTILGHTRISTTLEIYTDTGDPAQRDALSRLHGLLDGAQDEAQD